jgi:hypothetical protein
MTRLRKIAPGVHVAEAPQRFGGVALGARMTVLELEGGLFVHSPLAVDPGQIAGEVGTLGAPRWVLAPNKFHHLYVGPWIEAGLEGWAAPGLPEKRPDVSFAGIVETGAPTFGDELEVVTLTCFDFSNEVVVLHKPSRTLVVTDLVFHFTKAAPWPTRAAFWCIGGYPGVRTTVLEKLKMKRDQARKEIGTIAQWDFDRIVMAHGEVVETGGRDAFRHAFKWLGLEG